MTRRTQSNQGATARIDWGTGISRMNPRTQKKITGTQTQWINSFVWC